MTKADRLLRIAAVDAEDVQVARCFDLDSIGFSIETAAAVHWGRLVRFEFRLVSGLLVTLPAVSVEVFTLGPFGSAHLSRWEFLRDPEGGVAVDVLVAALTGRASRVR
jgi:hypothetical protein